MASIAVKEGVSSVQRSNIIRFAEVCTLPSIDGKGAFSVLYKGDFKSVLKS